MENMPKIGVGVIVINNNKVLLGRRKNAHGESSWGFPGGHLELNEQIEDCARREVREEAGINIKNIRMGTFTEDIFKKEGKHYVTLFIVSEYASGEAIVMEPDKCEKWEWFEWSKLPQPLFLPIQNLLKQNFSPFKQ
ncbi:NUDIX domain-containing protein [Candidatus Woesearchaeota archaeon]|nr:NUDIX domain-containing protein [Candidatus Woesearchaeota archaeon]